MAGYVEPLTRAVLDFWYLKIFRKICKTDHNTEIYIILFLGLLAVGSILFPISPNIWFCIALFRFFDLFAVNLRMVLFDCAYRSRGRTLIISGINYVQVILIFSIFYQRVDATIKPQEALEIASDSMRTFGADLTHNPLLSWLIRFQGFSAFAFVAIVISYLVQLRGTSKSEETIIPTRVSLPSPINFMFGALVGLFLGLFFSADSINLLSENQVLICILLILASTTFVTSKTVSSIDQFGNDAEEKLKAFMKAHLNFYAVIILIFISTLYFSNKISQEFFIAVFVGICMSIGIKLYKSSGD